MYVAPSDGTKISVSLLIFLLGSPIDSDVLICGDDRSAVREVSAIVARIPGCRPLDAGELSNATAIEAFTAVLLQLNVRYKTRVAPKLTGIRGDA